MAWLFGLTFGYMQDDQTMKVCSCLVPLTTDMRSRKKQAVPAPRGVAFADRLSPLWLGAPAASSAVTCLQHQNRSPYTDIGFFPCFGLF